MDLSSQVLFLLSAFGALNAFFLSIYFAATAKQKKFSNYFLALLLLVLSIRILKSAFFHFSPRLADQYIQVGLSACSLIGPFLFLYIKNQVFGRVSKTLWLTKIMGYLIIMIYLSLRFPYWENKFLWTEKLIPLLYLQWFIYIVLSGFYLKKIIRKLFNKSERVNDVELWILNVFFGVIIIWFAYVIGSYTSYIVGALSFSFIFYLLILLWIFKNKKNSLFYENKGPYENKTIEPDLLYQIESRIDIIEQKELYKNADIKLSDIAKEMSVSTHVLSQYLNDNLGKSYSFFVNEYRIEEAKRLLKSKPQYTIEAIGYESGFNSKSTFFTVFKKLTGITPAKYRNKL